jgi:hypothetical protein
MKELLRRAKEELATRHINPVDAELLLAHAAHVTRMDLHSKAIEFTAQIREDFQGFINERLTGRPTQYIIGEAAFRYLDLEVGEGVLIPRPETELLVDEVLHNLNRFDETVSIVDLGAGSGAISIALQTETQGRRRSPSLLLKNRRKRCPGYIKISLNMIFLFESLKTMWQQLLRESSVTSWLQIRRISQVLNLFQRR